MELYWDEIDSDILILAADGGLNADTSDQLIESLEKLIKAGLRNIIVDCSRLKYISSYGLGVLIRIHGKMKKIGGDVKIAQVQGMVTQALHVTHLDSLFEIYPDVNRARLSFRPKTSSPEISPGNA